MTSSRVMRLLDLPLSLTHLARMLLAIGSDCGRLLATHLRSNASVHAEVLMLRKQIAFYHERGVKPRRLDDPTRLTLVLLTRIAPSCRACVTVVKPATLVRWHRHWARLLWRRRSQPTGRQRVPHDVRALIRRVARENPTWGEERICNEILLKTGVQLSPRSVRRYMPKTLGSPRGDQRWMTFVRNHAKAMLACDLLTVWTVGFTTLYVLVVMEIGTRRIVLTNVTSSPTSAWIQQQLRQAIPCDHAFRFLIHDRDSIFSKDVDRTVETFGIRPLKTPVRSPQANAYCERLIGTVRRECLDWVIPIDQHHLKTVLDQWARLYNHARPHSSLGPGIPQEPDGLVQPRAAPRHALPEGSRVVSRAVLGGLHHEYRLVKPAA